MVITALALAVAIQGQQSQVSERAVRELIDMGSRDRYALVTVSKLLDRWGYKDLSGEVLREMEPKPYWLAGKDAVGNGFIEIYANATKREKGLKPDTPEPIRRAIETGDPADVRDAVDYIRKKNEDGETVRVLRWSNAYIADEPHDVAGLCAALLHFGRFNAFKSLATEIGLFGLKGKERAGIRQAATSGAPGAAIVLLEHDPDAILLKDVLQIAAQTGSYAEIVMNILEIKDPEPVPKKIADKEYRVAESSTWYWENPEVDAYMREAYDMLFVMRRLSNNGQGDGIAKIVRKHWEQVANNMTTSPSGPSTWAIELPEVIGERDLVQDAIERLLEEYEARANSTSEVVLSTRIQFRSAAARLYILVGERENAYALLPEDEKRMHEFGRFIEEGKPFRAYEAATEGRSLINDYKMGQVLSVCEPDEAKRIIRMHLSNERTRNPSLYGYEILTHLVKLEMTDELRDVLQIIERTRTTSIESLAEILGFYYTALGDDTKGVASFRKAEPRTPFWTFWQARTGRPLSDFMKIGLEEFVEAWYDDTMARTDDRRKVQPVFEFIVLPSRGDEAAFRWSMNYVRRLLDSQEADARADMEYEFLFRAVTGRPGEMTAAEQDIILETILEERKQSPHSSSPPCFSSAYLSVIFENAWTETALDSSRPSIAHSFSVWISRRMCSYSSSVFTTPVAKPQNINASSLSGECPNLIFTV